uniref:Uncharacterized protein n=1 Tax=Triticum urartu TaxID=4572 RepID=A0A8R7Q9T9_TRIUA
MSKLYLVENVKIKDRWLKTPKHRPSLSQLQSLAWTRSTPIRYRSTMSRTASALISSKIMASTLAPTRSASASPCHSHSLADMELNRSSCASTGTLAMSPAILSHDETTFLHSSSDSSFLSGGCELPAVDDGLSSSSSSSSSVAERGRRRRFLLVVGAPQHVQDGHRA